VLHGIEIGRRAIVGAGAVVTKSATSNEIWAGVFAHKISKYKS
jgi:UDP-2-acetamido-3-amino-2,3-dideoxy-glucuronate N-acetyltransferase